MGEKKVLCGLVVTMLIASAMWIIPSSKKVAADEVPCDITGATRAHALGYDGTGILVGECGTGLDTGSNATVFSDFEGRVKFWLDYAEVNNADGIAEDGYGLSTPAYTQMAGDGSNGTRDPVDNKLYGLGAAPGANIIVQRIFTDVGGWAAPDLNTLWGDARARGAFAVTNSWGTTGNIGQYLTTANTIDTRVRDAVSGTPGDQPLVILMAAGNYDLSDSADSKNGITVGVSEGYKPHKSGEANDIDEWYTYSADGPTADGRIKPDFVVPGTWMAGVRSHTAGAVFTGNQIISQDYLYVSGTGHGSALACGATAVFAQYYNSVKGAIPSPAITKAALVNGATDMDDAINTPAIPNGMEGWGRLNLTNVIAPEFDVFYDDQSTALLDNQNKTYSDIFVDDASKPFKITLVWTDVPALATTGTGRALVNDLDLIVKSPSGKVYKGNGFTHGWSNSSITTRDTANNVECVYLQVPELGRYTIVVNGTDIVQDAVSSVAGVNQDFALVVSGMLSIGGGPVVTYAYADPNPTNGASISTLRAVLSDINNVASAEYFIDSTGANGTGTTMSPQDGLFNSPSETAISTLDIVALGWVPGEEHMIYVHGKDDTNKWGGFYSVRIYIGTGYYLHVETSVGLANSLLTMKPNSVGIQTNQTGDIATPGQYKVGVGWLSAQYASATDCGGTWRYVLHGYETSTLAAGFLYAKVYMYDTMTLVNPNPAQCPTNINSKTSFSIFEWSETVPAVTIQGGDRIYVEIWLNATSGGGGSGVTTYSYIGVTQTGGPHDAYFCDVDDNSQAELTTPNLMPELTDAEYVSISTSNNVRATSADPGNQDEIFARYRFQVSESKNYITGITLTHEAQYSAAVTCTMYAYNYATSLWTQVGTTQNFGAAAEATMARSITSSYADYISSAGGLNWGVYASARATCGLDYVKTDVSYSVPYPKFILGYDNGSAPSMVVIPEIPGSVPLAWCNITVVAGWNLVSVPMDGPAAMPGALLDKTGGVVWTRAMWYDSTDAADHWKQYNTVWASSLNDLTAVDETRGVWLYVTTIGDGQICVGGTGYSTPVSTAISLRSGWNLAGFPSDDTTYTVANLKAACPTVTLVERFDGAQTYKTTNCADAYAFVQGQAYWVYNSGADTIWNKVW